MANDLAKYLLQYIANPQVVAFGHVIKEGEVGDHTDRGYSIVNGAPPIEDFSDHPTRGLSTRNGGRASGAYQAIPSTWEDFLRDCGPRDFSKESQDLFLVYRLHYRKALEAVLAGDLPRAIVLCRQEWTSLPGAAEWSGRYSPAKAEQVFRQFGGTIAAELEHPQPSINAEQPAAPIEERSEPLQEQEPSTMAGSFLDALGPIATAINPIAGILINLFTPKLREVITKEADRHSATKGLGAELSDLVIQRAQAISGKVDPLEAVAVVRQDPAKVAEVELAAAGFMEQYLAMTAPLLDKIDAFESNAAAQTEASRDSAANRASKDSVDLAPIIFQYIANACAGSLIFLGLIMLIQTWKSVEHEPSTAMLTLVGPLLGGLFAALASIVAYRFGEKRQSSAAAQTGQIIDNVTRSKAFQQRMNG